MSNIEMYMSEAERALEKALFTYENNGTRYEPTDRQDLINLLLEVEKLRKRLTLFMAQLPYLDHHPIGNPIPDTEPNGVKQLFSELENSQFINPQGPLKHHLAFLQLRELFDGIDLSIIETYYLLRKQRLN